MAFSPLQIGVNELEVVAGRYVVPLCDADVVGWIR
jgi:hypothetical protein